MRTERLVQLADTADSYAETERAKGEIAMAREWDNIASGLRRVVALRQRIARKKAS